MGTIDMSAASAPPKRRTPNTRAAAKAIPAIEEAPIGKIGYRETGLNGLGQLGQGLCAVFGLHADAAAIGMFFPPVATELAKVAETNETIAKPIDFLIEVGPYGALIGAVMPFAFQIAANHGLINPAQFAGQGVVAPAVLEARMQEQMLRMAADAQRAQNEALTRARQAQQEYNDAMAQAEAA
jgi:hypothetical protein